MVTNIFNGEKKNSGFGKGELYERLDTFDENPTKINGEWRRIGNIPIINGKVMDTVYKDFQDKTKEGHFIIFADNIRLTALNFTRLDSSGNDNYPGSAIMTKYSIEEDSIRERFIYGNSYGIEWYERRHNNESVRKIDLIGNRLYIKNFNPDNQSGNIIIFEKDLS